MCIKKPWFSLSRNEGENLLLINVSTLMDLALLPHVDPGNIYSQKWVYKL